MMRRTGFARTKPANFIPQAERVKPVAVALTRLVRYATPANDPVFAVPKSPRAENKHLLSMARGMPCLIRSPICVCGTETTVACHGGGVANGKGTGYKVGDHLTAHGCHQCNHYTDAYSKATAEQKTQAFDQGHARQVLLWHAIAADGSQPAKDRAAAQWAINLLGSKNGTC